MQQIPYKPRPAWMVPTQYNDAPEIPTAPVEDEYPIDYSKGPHNEPLGEVDDDDPAPEEDDS